MRWSKAFIPTLRDNPADVDSPAGQLLIRAGFVRRVASGLYALLPLGQRTMLKIAAIVRQEMNEAGAQEFELPLQAFFTDIARNDIRSYKNLPQLWYAIEAQSVDEAGARSGLLHLRRFTTNSCRSLDVDLEGVERSYRLLHDTCARICRRCGLDFVNVEAGPALDGAAESLRFMVRTETGEATVVGCTCGYAADRELASSRLPVITDSAATGELQQVHTPGQKTIADVSRFLEAPASRQIKTLVYIADRPVVFLVRGDHQLNENKARAAVEAVQLRPALAEEMRTVFGAGAGSLGPVGLSGVPVFADLELRGRRNMICGANRDDYHLTGVVPGTHFDPVWADLRTVEPGEDCVRCGRPLEMYRATEVGRIAKSGADASVQVLTADGRQSPILIGSCQIVLEQIMATAVELHHDLDGIVWPTGIAPFSVVVTPVTQKGEVGEAGERIYSELDAAGCETLLDDRHERPGVKFKDADLIGIPYRVVLGGEKLKQGQVELIDRAGKITSLVNRDELAASVKSRIQNKF